MCVTMGLVGDQVSKALGGGGLLDPLGQRQRKEDREDSIRRETFEHQTNLAKLQMGTGTTGTNTPNNDKLKSIGKTGTGNIG